MNFKQLIKKLFSKTKQEEIKTKDEKEIEEIKERLIVYEKIRSLISNDRYRYICHCLSGFDGVKNPKYKIIQDLSEMWENRPKYVDEWTLKGYDVTHCNIGWFDTRSKRLKFIDKIIKITESKL